MLRRVRVVPWSVGPIAQERRPVAGSEVVKVYPSRNAVPREAVGPAASTTPLERVDVLVYVGMFLTEKPGIYRRCSRQNGDASAGPASSSATRTAEASDATQR